VVKVDDVLQWRWMVCAAIAEERLFMCPRMFMTEMVSMTELGELRAVGR
jgi:hypothetical protein